MLGFALHVKTWCLACRHAATSRVCLVVFLTLKVHRILVQLCEPTRLASPSDWGSFLLYWAGGVDKDWLMGHGLSTAAEAGLFLVLVNFCVHCHKQCLSRLLLLEQSIV